MEQDIEKKSKQDNKLGQFQKSQNFSTIPEGSLSDMRELESAAFLNYCTDMSPEKPVTGYLRMSSEDNLQEDTKIIPIKNYIYM